VLVVPTVPRTPRIAEVQADPIACNQVLGTFNDFVNLLDLSAVTVPAGMTADGVPVGITLIAPAWSDDGLLSLAVRLHAKLGSLPPPPDVRDRVELVVVGAHLAGMPLHHQLVERGARFVAASRTAPEYRLFELRGSHPPKPGLLRVDSGGEAIEVEVYSLPAANFGRLIESIPSPLGVGRVHLEDGSQRAGFLCESVAVEGARDITSWGGWRAYAAHATSGSRAVTTAGSTS
jgi:allophanate hydrolase